MEAQLQYRQKLEQQIGKLVQNFGGMIKASQIHAGLSEQAAQHSEREELQSAVHAENMANAGSILLQMAAELKLSFVLQDLEAANADVDATNAALQDRCAHADDQLVALSDDVALAITELEEHYLASHHR